MDVIRFQIKSRLIKRTCFHVCLLMSFCSIGSFAWNAAAFCKEIIWRGANVALNPWTSIYFHPVDASLVNYFVTCMVMAFYGIQQYSGRNQIGVLRSKLQTVCYKYPPLIPIFIVIFVFLLNPRNDALIRLTLSAMVLFAFNMPIKAVKPYHIMRINHFLHRIMSYTIRNANKIYVLLTILILALTISEPLAVIIKPVYVINEYKNIYSSTRIGDKYVNNLDYLQRKNIDAGSREEVNFLKTNSLEFYHQNASWGPFNHIGHILNPLNEIMCGKDLDDIYLQYGKGTTLLYKSTMEATGGISVDNYYKCYVYYIVYAVLFALLLLLLFKDKLYVLIGMIIYGASFYSLGYTAFIHAPGFIPLIHIFDTTVIALMLLYYKQRNIIYLVLSVIFLVISVYFNKQFGLILMVSMVASCVLYLCENKSGKQKYAMIATIATLPILVSVSSFFQSTQNADSVFSYFLMGYLSWKPSTNMVLITIAYLSLSYLLLIKIHKHRYYLKYAFVFVFFYSQGLLVYYYWSGVSNHLSPVMPFVGMGFLFIIYIYNSINGDQKCFSKKLFDVGLVLTAGCLLSGLIISRRNFYDTKHIHQMNFLEHKLYKWDFERAKIISTIDPTPIRNSVEMISRYAPGEHEGIYIISVYDNILPFLAGKYSKMPFFDMQWFIFSPKESAAAIRRIQSGNPEYLFVDNDINMFVPDPWGKYFVSENDRKDRISNQQRKIELGKIFNGVKNDYYKIAQSDLISVYRKRID